MPEQTVLPPHQPPKKEKSGQHVVLQSVLIGAIVGGITGAIVSMNLGAASGTFSGSQPTNQAGFAQDSVIIDVVEQSAPAVVSIIVSRDVPRTQSFRSPLLDDPFFRQFFEDDLNLDVPSDEFDRLQVAGGSGFIVSSDGYIVTNKHVVDDPAAAYSIVLNDDRTFEAEVLARDPSNDIAVLKVESTNLPTLPLGDSETLKLGQQVIAIGNALGEFRNTVSTGIISGLARNITAGGVGFREQLSGVIQTDAAINSGNSGGPLLNLSGQVIGMNTAVASRAQGIAFTIPSNDIHMVIESIREHGRIVRAFLGVRFMLITPQLAEQSQIEVDYGALIVRGQNPGDLAVVPGSPADQAGLVENDIILEVEGRRVDTANPLSKIISRHQPGDQVRLLILHDGQEIEVTITLVELEE